jgi:hypothetical protein
MDRAKRLAAPERLRNDATFTYSHQGDSNWFAGAAGRGERRARREAKNRAVRRNRRPLPAIDFMPFLTHL